MSGKLWVVPTPIGNLEDITLRALRVLGEVDLILAEDTRTTGVLLRHHGVSRPVRSYHMHNEHRVVEGLVEELRDGSARYALVSDAGMPGISDPGYLLIRECIRCGVDVEVLPGACAAVTALVQSGLPSERFYYAGFLPMKKGRRGRLTELLGLGCSVVIYESCHRVVRLLKEVEDQGGGERAVCVCRELTKLHAESVRGSVSSVLAELSGRERIKGELVVVLSGQEGEVYSVEEEEDSTMDGEAE